MVSPSCYCALIIVLSCFYHPTIGISSPYYHIIDIVLWHYHHRTAAFLPSYYSDFVIKLSHYHHRTAAFSPSYYRLSGADAHIHSKPLAVTLPAFSHFPTMFPKYFYFRVVKSRDCGHTFKGEKT